jgi:hypothetical protein
VAYFYRARVQVNRPPGVDKSEKRLLPFDEIRRIGAR